MTKLTKNVYAVRIIIAAECKEFFGSIGLLFIAFFIMPENLKENK